MMRVEDGVFEARLDCDLGATYKYLIDGKLSVPDPASRAQVADVHDESVVVNPIYPWVNGAWRGRLWHETVVYELHVGAMGGFKGVAVHLPRLKALGITAIELMPIADFPGQRNWGYDGVLPYAPDANYGTSDDLKRLVDEAHGYGLQVFLDVVYNHFGPDGNYISSYASKFFDDQTHTPWGGAINFELAPVRRFFIENAIYWLKEFRFDGLRFDAVHAIANNDFLLDMASEIRETFKERHIHLILENENNEPGLLNATDTDDKYNAQWTDDWHHCLHVLLTGESEGYYQDFQNPARHLARCLGEGFAYQGQPSKHADGRPRGAPSGHLPLTAFVICLQNHDQIGNRAMGERLSTLAKPEALNAAIILLLMTPQIPMIFMGEEWGETNPFLFFTDHHDELADAVRDGRRKEFAHFDAFVDPQKREKIPDPNAVSTFSASIPTLPETLTERQAGYLKLFETALSLRAMYIAPFLTEVSTISSVSLGESGVRASWKLAGGRILTVAANFGDVSLNFEPAKGKVLIGSSPITDQINHLPPLSSFAWISLND